MHTLANSTDDCFEVAVARYSPVLHEAARRLTGSSDEASDLVQDAVMRAWTFWDRFEPGSNARAWLHRILMNTFINAYRKQRRERDLFRAAGEETRRDAHCAADLFDAERDGLGDEVGAALETLPVEFRAVVELVDLGDLSYREVATRLGCPIGTVMSRLHRARKQLQEQLAEYARSEGFVEWAGSVAGSQAHAA
ncbi:MAG: polymerase sigma-54 factor rpoN [Myxococcaceae bacterium]|nr:polymerase sigma-54 factor rpoN [Myxococcaceae bacterium]